MKIYFLLTLFFSFCVSAHEGHHDLKSQETLPGASIYQLSANWKDQNSNVIKLSDLTGTARMVVMLFTRCETSCPLIVEDLKRIAAEIESTHPNKIKVTIFSIDSKRESPASLQAFALKHHLPDSWTLVTANEAAVAELAASLGVRYKRLSNGDFIHSNVIFFISSQGEIIYKKEGLNTPKEEFVRQIKLKL